MRTWLGKLLRDESGQGMVEYGLIIALVAVVLAASLTSMQDGVATTFENIVNKLKGSAS